MLALAVQLYYDPGARAELEALAEEGYAMAQRIGDPALLWWASHTAWKALWTPAHGVTRLSLAREGLAATRASGDQDSEAVALVVLAGTALEMGDRAAYEQAAAGDRAAGPPPPQLLCADGPGLGPAQPRGDAG